MSFSWVAVKEKKIHHFVGQVSELFDSPRTNISVKLLKKVGEKFVWFMNDVSIISRK